MTELVKMAQTNPKLAYISAVIFRQKYSHYVIRIEKTKIIPGLERKYEINTFYKYIVINDLELFLNMIKFFGKSIQKLFIANHPTHNHTMGSDWAEVNRIVNEYGFEALIDLSLGTVSKELWPHLTLPFKSVKSLKIVISSNADGIKLNQLCPKLKELLLHLNYVESLDLLNCELPYLQHLNVIAEVGDKRGRKDQIMAFFKKNPQIRSVYTKRTRSEFIKCAQECSLNLESVSLVFNDNENEPLHFKTVKHCALITWTESSLKNLSFSQLESFEISFTVGKLEKLVEFFKRHSNLKRLYLKKDSGLTLPLKELTAELPNLVEMIVKSHSNINIDDVTMFIESHRKLKKFQFPPRAFNEADRRKLHERFEQEWDIKRVPENNSAFVLLKL